MFTDLINQILPSVIGLVKDISPRLRVAAQRFGDIAKVVVDGLIVAIDALTPVMNTFDDVLLIMIPHIGDLANNIVDVLNPALQSIGNFADDASMRLLNLLGLGDSGTGLTIEVNGEDREVFTDREGRQYTKTGLFGAGESVFLEDDPGIQQDELDRFNETLRIRRISLSYTLGQRAADDPIVVPQPVVVEPEVTGDSVEGAGDVVVTGEGTVVPAGSQEAMDVSATVDEILGNQTPEDVEALTDATSVAFAHSIDLNTVIDTVSTQLENLWSDSVEEGGTLAFSNMSTSVLETITTLTQNIETAFTNAWDAIVDDFESRRPILTLGGVEIENRSLLADFAYENFAALREDGRLYEFV